MCFAIFLDVNEFLEEVGKSFVGTGGGVTRSYKCILGAGDDPTRP